MANQPSIGSALAIRFWKKVRKTRKCWLWMGNRNDLGYGIMCVLYKATRAHRISWKINRGAIPAGKKVLHRCDNPPCVRPSHLFIGTQADNAQDMWNKKRGHAGIAGPRGERWHKSHDGTLPTGEDNANSKLTEKDVLAIRRLATGGMEQRPLAKMFGVTQATISVVVSRRTWRFL
jgi:plasmid maintenance system antidote protein VapI